MNGGKCDMKHGTGGAPEIESFNLADLDVATLDVRLELTAEQPDHYRG